MLFGRKELIDAVAADVKLPKGTVEKVIASIFTHMARSLREGAEVRLRPYLSLSVVERHARTARKPGSDETISIPAKKVVRVRTFSGLKDCANT